MNRLLVRCAFIAVLCVCGCNYSVIHRRGPKPHPPGRAVGWHKHDRGLVLIEGTGVMYVADTDGDIFFYDNCWYRHDDTAWYACTTYGGTWMRVSKPPAAFYKIPQGHAKGHVISGRLKSPGPGTAKVKVRGRGRWQ